MSIKAGRVLSFDKVIAVYSHDTQSAVTAVPSPDTEFLFISCGTWSLLGGPLY